ncbi:YkgJ family cysteine cluster protein [Lysobacter koreensis]|uniref:YkgJ family cysteine cluster protein n=1 Tax=Lysobacter koreensis TaxID=266122 RepID=A0ABW2YT48_9GAMM
MNPATVPSSRTFLHSGDTRHPCLSCGACCAAFRVAFHWSETDAASDGGVDAALTQPLDPHRVAMRGTFAAPIRCTALRGTVGRDAHCSVYAQRPSPCRELQPAWEHGGASPQCDRARAAHGLPALAASSWSTSS